jgi:hypothetical protein
MSTSTQPPRIACPQCQAQLKSAALPVGSLVNCPKCGHVFRLGAEDEEQRESKTANRPTQSKAKVKVPSTEYSVPRTPAPPGPARSQSSESTKPPPPAVLNPKSKIENPKSNSADPLVDPNLLAPPPPRVKPKPKEVPIVCLVCGTRSYAPLELVGKEIKCPDCYSPVLVPPLPEAAGKGQASGPTLEDAEDYGMSEVVERPRYRPLVAPRGEYEVLSALDPATMEYRLTVPGEKPRATQPATTTSSAAGGEEIALAPPVQVVEEARDPRTFLPQPKLEPENELYDGRYDDGLIGDGVDRRAPDAWKRAPLVLGIVEFLFFPGTLLRWFAFAVPLVGVATLAQLTFAYLNTDDNQQVLGLLLMKATIPAAAVWLAAFASSALAVVQSTGNGENDVTSWPDWNFYEWFANAMYMLLAMLAAGLPGALIASATLAASPDPAMAIFGVAAPPILSLMILFPIILYSMLTEDSFFAILSGHVMRSFSVAAGGWVFFYMYCILIFLFGGVGAGLMLTENIAVRVLAAVGVVALMLLYCRVLGRLIWYANQRLAASGVD